MNVEQDHVKYSPSCKRVNPSRADDCLVPVVPDPQKMSSMSLLERTLIRPEQLHDFLNRFIAYQDMGEWQYQLKDGSRQIFPSYIRPRRWSLSDQDSYKGLPPWKRRSFHKGTSEDAGVQSLGYSGDAGSSSESHVFRYVFRQGDEKRIAVEKHPATQYDYYSGTALRRLSLGDLDRTDLVFRGLTTDTDEYDYPSRCSSPVSESIDSPQHDDRYRRSWRFWVRVIVGIAKILCFPAVSLRFWYYLSKRWSTLYRRSTSAATGESSATGGCGRWRMLLWPVMLFCFPFAFAYAWKTKDFEVQKKFERGKIFEEKYVRRHGVHSKPYLQSQKARDILREKRDLSGRMWNVILLVGKILKILYGDLVGKESIIVPDEEKGDSTTAELVRTSEKMK